MYDVIRIPMRTNKSIDGTEIFDNVEAGGVFYFDPDVIFHKEFFDAGFLENILKEECNFYCNIQNIQTQYGEYKFNEQIDVENFNERQLWDLCLIGRIRKELKTELDIVEQKTKSNIKKEKNKVKTFKYKDVAKALNIKLSELKKKAIALDIKILDKNKEFSKAKMNKLIEALK